MTEYDISLYGDNIQNRVVIQSEWKNWAVIQNLAKLVIFKVDCVLDFDFQLEFLRKEW